ncbi:MAG TPA: thiamine pyrophosphate-dependent enzyme [Anaerovoracaceae bacterium]|nr:thiamine pyrophosphate-dependent enzyme [Anaerovoracaceae bacterium]
MAISKKIPEIITDQISFCPGCGHGVVVRLIAECIEELGLEKNSILSLGVGCYSLMGASIEIDKVDSLHGRGAAVSTGLKRCNPDALVFSYQGDGDAYSIGIGESVSAAYRNENITVITVNNTNYGMTGGQMSSTTMPGQITATSPLGRDCLTTGMPMKFPELVANSFPDVAYVARGTVTTPAHVNKLKKYIMNGFKAQMNNEGYSLIEVLSPCPTNWGMTPLDSFKRINEELMDYYPLGELKKREEK